MRTVRDHIASHPAVPGPPPGATHVMVWEPYGPSRSQWALGALDAPAGSAVALFDGPPDLDSAELAVTVSATPGCPVRLSSRIEVDGAAAYYVTPAGGGQ